MKFLESFTVGKTNTLGYLPVPWEHSLSVLIHMVTGWTKNLPYHFLFLSPVVFFLLLLCILQVPIFLSFLSSSPPCSLSKFLVYFFKINSNVLMLISDIRCLSFLFFSLNLAKDLSILFIISKNQLLALLILLFSHSLFCLPLL